MSINNFVTENLGEKYRRPLRFLLDFDFHPKIKLPANQSVAKVKLILKYIFILFQNFGDGSDSSDDSAGKLE